MVDLLHRNAAPTPAERNARSCQGISFWIIGDWIVAGNLFVLNREGVEGNFARTGTLRLRSCGYGQWLGFFQLFSLVKFFLAGHGCSSMGS
jgi:hypothetical protein